jgi:hypothetical protein
MIFMSNQEQTFDPTLEAKLTTILAASEKDSYDLPIELLAFRALPNDRLKSLFENLDWFDVAKFTELYVRSVGDTPSVGIHDIDVLTEVFTTLGLVDEDINGYFAYKQDADDTNIQPLSDGTYKVNFSEELGFVNYGDFVISRTSSPAILMSEKATSDGPTASGVTAVNVWLLCHTSKLSLKSDFVDEVWSPAGVDVTTSLAGGYVYSGTFDAGILNSYSCDILGIPYNDGDLVLIPVECVLSEFAVTDSENNYVPLLLPVEPDAS